LGLDWWRTFPSEALSSDTVGLMLRVDCGRWGQTPDDLRRLALNAPHARTRERALALYDMAQGCCASQVAARTGRHPQTMMGWLSKPASTQIHAPWPIASGSRISSIPRRNNYDSQNRRGLGAAIKQGRYTCKSEHRGPY
jgi:hypothetical protein